MGLKDIQTVLVELVERRLIRPALVSELLPNHQDGYAFVLVCPQDIPMGDWDLIPLELIGDPPKKPGFACQKGE